MTARSWQRGESKLGCVVGLIIFGAAVWVAIQTFPVVINTGELQSEIQSQAERAGLPRHTEDYIRGRIVDKAEELHLPVTPDMVQIKRRKRDITIHLEYTVELDYGFYTYRWHKVHDVMRETF